MASRMERYYKAPEEARRRTLRNEDLYRTIYEDETYSNIEGVVETPKENVVDIDKIRELISKHEEQKKTTRQLTRKTPDLDIPETNFFEEDEDKNYDIRDILNKAKDARENPKEQYHSLKNTEYDILKGIKIKDTNENPIDKEEELKELINTITNTSMLNKLGNTALSLDMFKELQGDTMVGNSSIQSILEDAKEEKEQTAEMDNSFYTSSLNFKEKDFEQLQDIHQSIKSNNKMMRVILIILFIVIAGLLIFGIFQLIQK